MTKFEHSKENEVLSYVVHDENTLGYLFKSGTQIELGILGRRVSEKGIGYEWGNGPINVTHNDQNRFREATKEDFDLFRVCCNGHI